MTLSTDPYKGVRDFYPEDAAIQRHLFDTWSRVAESFGFERYDASVLEPAELYRAKTGEEIVNEQTYTFIDRGDREVTLRPEMTPTVARMVAARQRELPLPLRWYSIPNLFRYERPQRGRLREHWQLNCDIFGANTVEADAEIISLAHAILVALGATEDDFTIYLNDREMLNEYFASLDLSPEQVHQMYKLLDRKDKIDTFTEEVTEILGRPFDEEEIMGLTSERLVTCVEILRALGIKNVAVKPSIVRGLDYYTGIVYEIYDTHPDNRRALFGGGRYDNLLEMFGSTPITGVGFGMGDVALRDFLETHDLLPEPVTGPAVLLLPTDTALTGRALVVREELRGYGISCAVDFSGRKLAEQLTRASKRSTPYIIVVGEEELARASYTLKRLADGEETVGSLEALAAVVHG